MPSPLRRRVTRRDTRPAIHPQRDGFHEQEGEPEAEQAREEIVSRTAASAGARAEALRKADGGTRLRAVQQMQSEHGNAYVQRMVGALRVQRQPTAGVAAPDKPAPAGAGGGGEQAQQTSQDGGGGGGAGSVTQLSKDEIEMVRKVNHNWRIAEGEELFAQSEAQNRANRYIGGGMSEADAVVLDENLSAMRQMPGTLTWDQRNALFDQFIELFQKKAYDLTLYALDQAEKVARKEYTRYNPAADVDAYSREAASMNRPGGAQGDVADFQMAPRNEQMDELKQYAGEMAPIQAGMVERVKAEGRRQAELIQQEELIKTQRNLRSVAERRFGSGPSSKDLLAQRMRDISPENVEDFLDDGPKEVESTFGKESADVIRGIRDSQLNLLVTLKNIYGERFPILLARKTNYQELATATPEQVQKHVAGRVDQVLEDVSTARDKLSPDKVWSLPAVVEMTERMMGVTPGFGAGKLIDIQRQNRATASAFKKIALAVLQIGLSLIPGVGWAFSLAIGAYNLSQDVAEHRLGSALHGASLDPAKALAAEDSGYGWLALDIVGMVADVGVAASSFRTLAKSMKAMEGLGDAAKGAKALASAEEAFGAGGKIATDLAEVEQIVRAQARVLSQEGKLAQGLSEELFVERVMSSLRRQVASKGAVAEQQAGVLARVIDRSHPNYGKLMNNDRDALLGLLIEHGEWKSLVMGLERGGQGQIAKNLLAQRQTVMEDIGAELKMLSKDKEGLKVSPMKGGSEEAVSDIDVQIGGPEAGQMLIEAEAYMARRFGENWSQMFRMNFYTEGGRLTRYEDALKAVTIEGEAVLKPAQKAALTRRMTAQAERLNFARMLEHAGSEPKALARVQKLAKQMGVDLDELKSLVNVGEEVATTRRNALLLEIDKLEADYKVADEARRAELAEQISSKQMEANFYTHEANIGPGSIAFSGVRGLEKQEAYQAALTQLEMIEHILAESGGDVARAAREYELFKYIGRFGDAVEKGGADTAKLKYLRNQAKAVSGGQREMMEETAHQFMDPNKVRAPVIEPHDLPQAAGAAPPVTDEFLEKQFEMFEKEAEDALQRLNPAAARKAPPRTRSAAVTAPLNPVKPAAAAGEAEAARIIDRSTNDMYVAVDSTNARFQVTAKLESGDELLMLMRTELDGKRSAVLRGAEQFRMALDYFGGRVKGIRGAWSYGTNLQKFNELTAAGKTAEEAALATWTGQQASVAGYGRVVVRGLDGKRGAYSKVDVLFQK